MTDCVLSIAAWVIQDGNYPNFARGQTIEVAVEFYAPDPLAPTDGNLCNAVGEGDGWYVVEATVVAVLDEAWVLDCGILVYGEYPPPDVHVGDGVRGRILLSVDHFAYFERLAKRPAMPSLIYTWELTRIRQETAPFILDTAGKVRVRDETRRKLVEIDATDAWNDDDGHSEYVFDCRLFDLPPKRTSSTAR